MKIYIQTDKLIFRGLTDDEYSAVIGAIPTAWNVSENHPDIVLKEKPQNLYYILHVISKDFDIELI